MCKQAELDVCNEVLSYYEWQGTPRIIPGPSGMNNTTLVVEDDVSKSIVRLYNGHEDKEKLQFEHLMLSKLQQCNLPISTPSLKLNKQQATITVTRSGKLAAAFHYIEGERPSVDNLEQMISLARAAAELSKALSTLTIDEQPAYSPYYELESNYAPIDHSSLLELLGHEELVDLEEQLLHIQGERLQLEALKPQFQALPHQWIHGDLNNTNCLAIHNDIVALLDFEFVTLDLRVMELAVLLTEMISRDREKDQSQMKLNAMLQAFHEIVQLNEQELLLLPQLIKLRCVDVVMHFINRFNQGLDAPHVLRRIIEDAHVVLCQMNDIKLSIR